MTEKKRMRAHQGFTLVEIMITVAIIGLLAAIGIPSFQKARVSSIRNTQESNVRLVNNAVQMWAMDAFVPNSAQIEPEFTNFIKGGYSALAVGNQDVNLTNVTSYTVGHTFTVEELYPES